jgi:subtilase family protein
MRIARRVIFMIGGAMAALASGPVSADPGAALARGLGQLVVAWETSDPRLSTQLQLHVTSPAGDPLVLVQIAPGMTAAQVLPQLQAAGFQLTTRSSINPSLIEGYVPLAAARAVAAVAGVKALHATQRPVKHAGSVQSEAVALEKADLVQARGIDGTGIRLGALSDSFDTCTKCSTHAADDVKSGDLPAGGVTVLEDFPMGTDEGRAMLQLVHDLAPGAQLAFATANVGELDFAENILKLRSTFGADVIVDDVVYSDEPMYSDGIIAQAVDIVSQAGAAYFSSAGNNGLEAYESIYAPVPFERAQELVEDGRANVHLEQIPAAIRPMSVHNFGGRDGRTSITQRISTTFSQFISFQWDEPFFLGKVQTDFNIYVFDKDGNWQDPASPAFPGFYTTDNNLLTDAPVELVFLPPFPGDIHGGANVSDYQIVIGNVNDGPAQHIKYVNVNGLSVSQRQGAPSVFGHAAAGGAQAVAATDWAIPNFPEDFSSPGPVTIYLDELGNRLASPESRAVPQLTAADGVATTFFGNFFGTSAAAPDAAGVAALMLQSSGGPGSMSPNRIYRRLQETASPIPVPNDRSVAAAVAGPVRLSLGGDWVRWDHFFSLSVSRETEHSIASIALNTSAAGLIFSANPNRFYIGESNGVAIGDITRTRSADGSTFTLTFAPGKFAAGGAFTFGMSVFNPIEGTTQEDPDRFRGATVTVTLDDGTAVTGTVTAGRPQNQNRFTGAGLVNAAKAVQHDD